MPLSVPTKVLSEKSGLPVRQVQTLTDAGVLVPDEGSEAPGRGGSRHYGMSEVEVAVLLGSVSYKGMSAHEAGGLARTFRAIIRVPEVYGVRTLEQAKQLRRYAKATAVAPTDPRALRQQAADIIKELKPIWGHVKLKVSTVHEIEAWIFFELAKRGEAHPFMCISRNAEDEWTWWFFTETGKLTASTDRNDTDGPDAIEVTPYRSNGIPQAKGGYFIALQPLFRGEG